MKNNIYINGMGSISAQNNEEIFTGKVKEYNWNIFPAIDPDYRQFIPPMALRRMSKAVKMGFTAAKLALNESGISFPDAIITGTGQGCKQDTEKFLEEMLGQDEGLLSPTSFIQSTHNTVGGQIALHLKCNAYNVTYTQNSGSLESALIDAGLFLQESEEALNVLAGGVDEISPTISKFLYRDGQLKREEVSNTRLYDEPSPGTITSEGAHFFLLSSERKKETYARLIDIDLFHATGSSEVLAQMKKVLGSNNLSMADVDLVILGNNGDCRYDHFYHKLQQGAFSQIPQLCYKHLVGDYNTVSGFAIWLGSRILRSGTLPLIENGNFITPKRLKNILIYNQYLGENHSIILLGAP